MEAGAMAAVGAIILGLKVAVIATVVGRAAIVTAIARAGTVKCANSMIQSVMIAAFTEAITTVPAPEATSQSHP